MASPPSEKDAHGPPEVPAGERPGQPEPPHAAPPPPGEGENGDADRPPAPGPPAPSQEAAPAQADEAQDSAPDEDKSAAQSKTPAHAFETEEEKEGTVPTEEAGVSAPTEESPPEESPDSPPSDRKPSFLERPEYRVRLDVFNGPLDLLLYLIKRDEIDIHDIPIAHVAEEYVSFLDLMAEWNINAAGEFLLMAATLMEIKSRMLLPEPPPLEEDEEEWEDPRAELVRQLMEYKRYKEAALDLADRADQRAMRFARPGERLPQADETAPPPVLGVDVWRLAEAFQEILEATGADAAHRVVMDETPQEEFMERLLRRVEAEGRVLFGDLFGSERSRPALIGMFLALLELCRLFEVRAEQSEPGGDIWIVKVTAEDRAALAALRAQEEEESAPEDRPDEPAPSSRFKARPEGAPRVPFVGDELDAELAAVEVRDVREAPPPPPDPPPPQDAPPGEALAEDRAAVPAHEVRADPTEAPPEPSAAPEGGEGEGPDAPSADPSVTVSTETAAASPAAAEDAPPGESAASPEQAEASLAEAEAPPVGIPALSSTGTAPHDESAAPPEDKAPDDAEPTAVEAPAGPEQGPTDKQPDATASVESDETPAEEASAEAGLPGAAGEVRLPLGALSARVRWLGLFGLCPCRYSDWRRVTSADETHVALEARRRLWRGMKVGLILEGQRLEGRFELTGRVESCQRLGPRRFLLRARLLPFGPAPGHNPPAARKALRGVAPPTGDEA